MQIPEDFENGNLTLKTLQMFSVHTTPKEFKNATITVILDLCLRKSRDCHDVIVFAKCRLENVFLPDENEKLAFSNSSSLKSVFKKLRFRDGLVWTVGLTVETKLLFKSSRRSVNWPMNGKPTIILVRGGVG